VTVLDPEAYVFDEEVVKKAADLGKPGLVEIKQLQDNFIFRVEGTGVLPVRGGGGGMHMWAGCWKWVMERGGFEFSVLVGDKGGSCRTGLSSGWGAQGCCR
jgi:hypothetical protein